MKNINNFYLIPQLKLEGGLLKCRPIGSRYVKKVHFRQGELDGACGLYVFEYPGRFRLGFD